MEREGVELRAVQGGRTSGACELGDEPVSIGRWEGASLRVADVRLLPVHAVLDPEGDGRWRLIVLAAEGVLVDGRRTRRALLSSGDRIRLGAYELSIEGTRAVLELPARTGAPASAQSFEGEALHAVLRWRGTPLDARVLSPGDLLSVGAGRGVTFEIPPEVLGAPKGKGDPRRWAAIAHIDGVWHVALDTPLRALDLTGGGHPILSADLRAEGPKLPRGFAPSEQWVPLPPGLVRLDAGELCIEVAPASREALPKIARPAWWTTRQGQTSIILTMFLVMLTAMLHNPPAEPFRPEQQQANVRDLIAQFRKPPATEAMRKERERLFKKIAEKDQEQSAAKAKGEEGKAGRPDGPAANNRRGGPKSDAEIVKQHALLKALSSGATSELLSGGALSAVNSLGHLDGARVGDADGSLGLGLRGTGTGGGGLSTDTVGVGPVGTKGLGMAANGAGKVRGGAASELGIDEPASVEGGLDREVIRRVILSHRAQIRYCYEKQLQQTPGLAGKISVEFVIGGDGRVTQARAADQTIADPEVGRCIVSKVRTWTFPKPKGGGVVVVTYPFLFKPAGQGSN